MRYTGIQPQYFPRLHYFARILNTDFFMVRDDVQFVKKHKYPGGRVDKSYQVHTPIKTQKGRDFLCVPVSHQGFGAINKTRIFYEVVWESDQLKAIRFAYSRAPFFTQMFLEIEKLLSTRYSDLAHLNLATIIWGISKLVSETETQVDLAGLNTLLKKQTKFRLKSIARASESLALKKLSVTVDPNEKILALIRETGATEDYCGGTAQNAYMDAALFEKHGIKIIVQDWHGEEYPQQFRQHGFISNLSIIDLFMNVSLDTAREILKT